MDPVMRALQSIADIESETCELGQFEPASACRTTRFEPTTTYAMGGGTADLNGDLSALETNASEASGAWDEEIKIDRCDRIAIAPARDVTRHAVTLIGGSLLLAFCVVWLAGSDWHFTVEPALLPEKTVKSSADHRIVQNRANSQLHRRTRLLHQSGVCTPHQNPAFNL